MQLILPIKTGQFDSIFDADKTNLPLSKLITIEMGSLMRLSEKTVAPPLMYIFRYLEKLWNIPTWEKQPLTFLFLDKAWLYLQHPIFAGFFQEWLRTLRKKKVFLHFCNTGSCSSSKIKSERHNRPVVFNKNLPCRWIDNFTGTCGQLPLLWLNRQWNYRPEQCNHEKWLLL